MRLVNILVLTLFLSSCSTAYAHSHQPDPETMVSWTEEIVENHVVVKYKSGKFWAFPIIDRDTFNGECHLKHAEWKAYKESMAFAYCKDGNTLGFLVNTEFAWECDTCKDMQKHNSL
jgi:hypothetical protein